MASCYTLERRTVNTSIVGATFQVRWQIDKRIVIPRTPVLDCSSNFPWRAGVTQQTEEHLQKQWRDCYTKNKKLSDDIELLKAQLAEADRKREIACTNAYEDGYKAGWADAMKKARLQRSG
jgi:hypothetical protein